MTATCHHPTSSSPLKGASAFIRSASFAGVTRGFATTGVAMAGLRASLFPGSSSVSQMGLLGWLLADLAINWAGWGVAAYLKTELFYDLLGTSSFAVLAFGSLAVGGAGSARQILISCMVGAWVVRLGYFLVSRVLAHGSDSRFDGVRDRPATFFVYWTMQAVWVWVTLLPVLLINNLAAPLALAWRASDILGGVVGAMGVHGTQPAPPFGETQVRAAVGPKGGTARVPPPGVPPEGRQTGGACGQQCGSAHPATVWVWVTLHGRPPTPLASGCWGAKRLATSTHTRGVSPHAPSLGPGTAHTVRPPPHAKQAKQGRPHGGVQAAGRERVLPGPPRCAPRVTRLRACAGVAMFSAGLGMEATADAQKALFQRDPANQGRFIEAGLWGLSRHPNYLGEMMVWSGIFVTAAAAFTATPWMFVSIVSPVFVITLLSQLSGIPILEDRADKKWGHLEAYQRYKDTTPVLLPLWPSAWTLSTKKGAPLLTPDATLAHPGEHSAVPTLSAEPVEGHERVSPE
ncbi:MAG: hypothetical protein WDW36_005038 [Sanguina aurantia]